MSVKWVLSAKWMLGKRIFLLLVLMSGFFLATSCGNDDNANTSNTNVDDDASTEGSDNTRDNSALDGSANVGSDTTVGIVFDVTGKGDLSFNDSAAVGIERAADELGIDFSEAQPNPDGSNRPDVLQLAADSHDLVIAVGSLFEDAAINVAANNPDTFFAVVDAAMVDPQSGQPYSDNIAGLTFSEHQGSFLVGVAAALKSQTGTIGFIGGVANIGGLIEKFQAGYEAGAKAVNPDIQILSQYITSSPDFNGFYSPSRAKEIAMSMYAENDADIHLSRCRRIGVGAF